MAALQQKVLEPPAKWRVGMSSALMFGLRRTCINRATGPLTASFALGRFYTAQSRGQGSARDLYSILGIARSASASDIKRAYYDVCG